VEITIRYEYLGDSFKFHLSDREIDVLHQTKERGTITLETREFVNLIDYSFLEYIGYNIFERNEYKLGWRGEAFLKIK
jgi:hypothetical protein